jgi:hypothetical protein
MNRSFHLPDLLLIAILAYFACFWRLNEYSFHIVDESYHAKATQEMIQQGNIWRPTAFGIEYHNKPPFKMWLATIPVLLFGESNYSYRFIDALCGVLTTILISFFAFKLFQSRTSAILASMLLLGCNSYLFNHGVRTSTQDSMLVFLTTLALVLSWYLIEKSSYTKSILLGVIIGSAVLTKNIVGYLPFIIIFFHLILNQKLVPLIQQRWRHLLSCFSISILLPAVYIIQRSLENPKYFNTVFGFEILNRAVSGYHHVHEPFFYLGRLFIHRAAVPPELLFPAVVYGILCLFKKKDQRFSFLLCWSIIPLLIFSLAQSRLTWYLSPAYPGMSLLIAGMIANLKFSKKNLWQSLLLLLIFLSSGLHFLKNIDRIRTTNSRLAIDKLSDEVSPVVFYPTNQTLGRHEKVYRDMVQELPANEQTLATANIITPLRDLLKLPNRSRFNSYLLLEPNTHRKDWSIYLSAEPPHSSLQPLEQVYDMSGENEKVIYGLNPSKKMGGLTIRKLNSGRAAVEIFGDAFYQKVGAIVRVNLAQLNDSQLGTKIKIHFNGELVDTIAPTSRGFQPYEFQIAPHLWEDGRNILLFNEESQNTLESTRTKSNTAINWVKIIINSTYSGESE